ncbi:MAG TPA: TonB-dependent receptor [Steroidobacteraceae bacterium]|nr:TonB-dependent receptor [Steroidobacteraceae bacterium]
MNIRRSTLLGTAIAFALYHQSAMADAATSPSTDPAAGGEEIGEIIVTGIRASIQQSLDVKRNADTRLEVVTAEDVGKLPAHNVADALRGLPGVNISSSSADEGGFDESDRVSLRGTSPSLTQTLINGHSVGSADWFVLSQGNNVGRSVSYTLLPSELVNSVEVNKSSNSRLQEGGTTGTVNIITRKPFQFDKPFTVEASLGSVYADQADSWDPQISGLMNYKNENETFGVLLQVFSQERSLRRDAQEIPGGFFTIASTDPVAATNPDLVGVQVPGLIGATLFEQVRDRKGGLLELQFKPSDSLTLGLSGFYSDMDANNYNRNFMLWGGNFGRAQAPNPGYTIENGVLTSATYAGVAGRDYAVYDMISREATAKSSYITFDADWKINDSLTSNFQIGTTEGTGETARQFIAEVTTNRGGGASWTSHGKSSPLDWSVGGDSSLAGVTGFGTWGNQQVKATDSEDWANLSFTQNLDSGPLNSIDFGARYADHERRTDSPEGASPGDIWSDLQNGATAPYPSDFAKNIDGTFPRDLWYFTTGALKEAILANSTWLSDDDSATGRHNYGGEWKVAEKNLAAYVQANFGNDSWSGNVGLRYVNIDQEINSYQAVASAANADVSSLFGNWIYQNTDNKHNKVLPSANLKFHMADDVVFRFAASQTMTLPDYSALGASSWGSDLNKTGGGGNPNLKPVISTNFDGNLEWYFMPRGLLSVGAFSMDLKDYVAFGTENRQLFSELTNQLETYLVSVPVNSNGSVTGLELVYEQPIGDSFGVNANYTYSDGKTAHTWADGSNNLVGTSKDTYNVGLYFENQMFSARANYTYRTSFLIGLSGANPYYQDDFGTLSLALNYKPTEWLNISLDALNLNNPDLTYYQSATAPTAFYNNGRQYYLNLRFKF